ncbi:MAG TPA: DCC1-like thiol-disulfide oxidoreductase family protein, partial [Phycisphaerae bacterium]|nr:DCC1-like thiol-disulfide oxidoreductase family protein [Phycisphaerae bacterium]
MIQRIESSDAESPPFRGWIFFDAGCGLCSTLRDKWGPIVEPRGFRLAALQESWVQDRLNLGGTIPGEMKFLTPGGRVLGGADAFVHIARHIWWAWPLWLAGATRPGL